MRSGYITQIIRCEGEVRKCNAPKFRRNFEFRFWGSRGINDLYKFQYQGKPAIIQQDDRILSPDTYWIQVGEGDKITSGKLTSDEGKEVYIGTESPSFPYTVREKQE